jgi:HK97 family phage portal protein
MGLFDKILKNEEVNTNEKTYSIPTSSLVKSSSYARASEGESTQIASVDEETALKISALNQGINIIGDTIASLPCYLYREKDGFHEVFYEDPRSKVLSDMANETLSAFNLKKAMLKDLILYGNAYAKIERNGENVSLRYLPKSVITPKMDSGGYYFEVQSYSTDVSGERYPSEIVDFYDMLVLIKNNEYNSITGKGLLDYANDIIATATEETNYMYNLLVNGLSSKAILNTKTPFRKEIKDQLKRDLKSYYSGSNNSGKIMILEGDVQVLPLAMTPTDMHLLENKKFNIAEIARYLNIPKHMLGLDRQQGTYSNITQERLSLLQTTLSPYVVLIEQAMNQKLLSDEEKADGYYFSFDTSEIMKMTPSDNADFILKLFEQNVVTIEEVRSTLGLGGDTETIEYLKKVQEVKSNTIDSIVENKTGEEVLLENAEKTSKEDDASEQKSDDKDKEKSSKEVKE